MTSIPASRSARAMIFAPRSWPSRPGLATTTRIFRASLTRGSVEQLRGVERRRDAVDEVLGRERLLDVVVRAGGDAALDRGLVDAGGEQQNRYVGQVPGRAEALGHLIAVELGHHHVDH